jgi:ligand-binding SRPBCC domain-containing protein
MRLGERVTWEARHFGLRWRLTTTISGVDEPRWFRDELVQGPFRRLVHDHHFELADAGTVMRDVFVFSSIVPPLDGVLVAPHLRRLLLRRNETIRGLAEGEGWREFVPER